MRSAISVCLAIAISSPVAAQDYAEADGAMLRFLDKLTSVTGDVTLSRGQAAQFGRLVVQLDSCRYPSENPTADASAHLTVVEDSTQATLFTGWMVASSPALSALDHPRYDVWVLSCVLPEAPAEAPAEAEE